MEGVDSPNDSFHSTHQLLSSAFPGVDGRRGGLVEMRLGGGGGGGGGGSGTGAHLVAVVVGVTSLAVTHRPVSMPPTAPG